MKFTDKQLDKPVGDLSVRELLNLIRAVRTGDYNEEKLFNDEWLSGLSALAKFLSVSKATVSRRLHEGVFDGAYIKSGHTFWFDRRKVRKLMDSNAVFK